jgi:hypothetical protein
LDEPIFPFLAFGLGELLVLVQYRWLPLGSRRRRHKTFFRRIFYGASALFVLGAFSVPSYVLARFIETGVLPVRLVSRLGTGGLRRCAATPSFFTTATRVSATGVSLSAFLRCLFISYVLQLPGSPGRDSVAASAVFGFFYVGGSRRSIRHGGSGFCSCSLSSLVAPTFVSHQPLRSLGAYSWPS